MRATPQTRRNRRPVDEVDEPPAPVTPIPSFRQPMPMPVRPDQMLPPGDELTSPDDGEERPTLGPTIVRGVDVSAIASGFDSPEEPRTRASSGSDERRRPANTRKLLGALLRAGFKLAGAILANAGRELRQPSRDHVDEFAAPVARILIRHVPARWLTDDLVDLAEAGEVAADYASEGPVLRPMPPRVAQVGMEHELYPLYNDEPVTPAAPTADMFGEPPGVAAAPPRPVAAAFLE